MIATDIDLEKQLIRHEGLRLQPYHCPAGKLTIGVGRNLDDVGITENEALLMLRNDIVRVRGGLRAVIGGFDGLSLPRQHALIDMCFNIGLPRFLEFKRMRSALADGDYGRAAEEMLDSRWARQVGVRAQHLASMMQEG